ncbi:MAG: discoidin domain-containing protein [Planctomycetes bacterium]|nr:discoidin domain-containing protein [Planctomycetota bacterium]
MAAGAGMGRGVLGLTTVCLGAGFALGFLSAPDPSSTARASMRIPGPGIPAVYFAATTATPASTAAVVVPKPEAAGAPAEIAATKPAPTQDSPKKSMNYALAANGATATGGQHAELLIDGNHAQYDGANGYAQTEWNATPPQAFVITFKQAEPTNAVRFLFWDQDNRFYRYKLDVCPDLDDAKWKTVADRSQGNLECRSWQVLMISKENVRRIRLTGTFGSANSGFHVVELEAYDAPAGLSKPWEDVEF